MRTMVWVLCRKRLLALFLATLNLGNLKHKSRTESELMLRVVVYTIRSVQRVYCTLMRTYGCYVYIKDVGIALSVTCAGFPRT